MAERKGLGKGLDALLGNVRNLNEPVQNLSANEDNGILEININSLDINTNQPRKHFDDTQLRELAASISHSGIIQPLIVKQSGDRFIIIAGERRWRAARMAGLKNIPVIIKKYTDLEIMEVALIENLQRTDLNAIEEANGINMLMRQYDFTQEEVASRIGKSRASVANSLRLLTLPKQIMDLLIDNKITVGHAKCILGLKDDEEKIKVAIEIIKKQLSVRQTEVLCKSLDKEKKVNKIKKDEIILDLQGELQQALETKVNIVGDTSKGKIIIEYYDKEQLERLYEFLKQ